MKIIDGKKISDAKRAEIKEKVAKLVKETGKTPGLATILVGADPASQVYIKSKIKACQDAGIKSFHHELAANAKKEEIISLIKQLNESAEVDGILLQLPLPDNSFSQDCINAISPYKDVDGLHPFNAGLLNLSKNWQELIDNNVLMSCTPAGVIHLLKVSGIEIKGKNAVVIGRSNLVGKPLSMMLLANDATVTMAHSKTKNLKEVCKAADIVVEVKGELGIIEKRVF